MKQDLSSTVAETAHQVSGIVRDQYQRPMPKMTVRAYNKTIRDLHLLGETVTNDAGHYSISYIAQDPSGEAVQVQVSDAKNNLILSSDVYFDVDPLLQVDLDISGQPFAGQSEYERVLMTVFPVLAGNPLSHVTETDRSPDISFIAKKTGMSMDLVSQLAMAARFASFSQIPADTWYGILRSGQPVAGALRNTINASTTDFETRLSAVFDALMQTAADTLVNGLQQSIANNFVAYSLTAVLPRLRSDLATQAWSYAQKHPLTGQPSMLLQKAQLGGLQGQDLQNFVDAQVNHQGADAAFWMQARQKSFVKNVKALDPVEAVFQLSRLTGDNMKLTASLMKSQKIQTPADLKKLAALESPDWAGLLKSAGGGGDAAQLERAFTAAFPTAAFTARLQKDKNSTLSIGAFLQANDQFDLANTRVGQFLTNNKNNTADLADQLRRVQRVFKLVPRYDAVSRLLNDKIHSAHQIVKMGQENFVRTYGHIMDAMEAEQVFQTAGAVHATAVALVGNLKSLSDASAMNVFPDFTAVINQGLVEELPNLDTLFGHTDFCACDECTSVYGAPAYLTDLLHFLENRNSTLIAKEKPNRGLASVKDILLQRRTEIGDIDLNCDNTNTEVPYIDIACEIMEDYIAAPVITVLSPSKVLPLLVKGPIGASLLGMINQQFAATGQSAVSQLLTSNATVSDVYATGKLMPDQTFVTQNHWMIRDLLVSLKVSDLGSAGLEFRLLHQTLETADAVSTAPEYVNVNAYNLLNTAKRPFTLPFDLFGTQAALYLEKAGVKRADLIDLFRTADGLPAGQSPTDLAEAYSTLGISPTEQTLIFQPDPDNQPVYWGTGIVPAAGAVASVEMDVFEKLTGLDYAQVVSLLGCNFINTTHNNKIVRQGLSCDTNMMSISNLTTTHFDAIHRFLRLWRKTTFTMEELDAIIMSPVIGAGKITTTLGWHLVQIQALQQSLLLNVFQVLALYQNLDLSYHYPDTQYNQLFQNSAVTSPVNPNFSAASVTSAKPLALTDVHKAVMAAVFQITVDEVTAILNGVAQLKLTNLSFCYRYAVLARSLKISVSDLLALVKLIDVNPFANPAATNLFVQKYKTVTFSGISIPELSYVLLDQDNGSQSLIPTGAEVAAALGGLQDDLLAVRNVTWPAPDAGGLLLAKWLSDPVFKWDPNLQGRLLDILRTADDDEYQQKIDANSNFLVNLRIQYHDVFLTTGLAALPEPPALPPAGTPLPMFPTSVAAQLSYDPVAKQLRLAGFLSDADHTALTALSDDAGWQAAVQDLFARQQTDNGPGNLFFAGAADVVTGLKGLLVADRMAFFLNRMSPVNLGLQQRAVLVKGISGWFNVNTTIAGTLLDAAPDVYTEFTNDDFVNRKARQGDAQLGPYPVQYARYRSVAKAAFIIRQLRLSGDVLDLVLQKPVMYGLLDLNSGTGGFAGWENLINLLRIEAIYPDRTIITNAKLSGSASVTVSIYSILSGLAGAVPAAGATDMGTFQSGLVTAVGQMMDWDADVLKNLAAVVFAVPASAATIGASLQRLYRCFAVLQQLGASVTDVTSWCKPTMSADDAARIKSHVKSRYSDSDWQVLATTLENTLRERKRDALIAYLLANPGTQGWTTDNDLFDYFLLDVEMCSCRPTSRIVEATNAVQLFVQRCFLSLEAAVIVDTKVDSTWLQWQWMKYFRLWQANVKVFLYPENYIEPELLPSAIKSSFLQDLENDLLQNEVTAENAEDAFQTYLQKLDVVARLEVKGMYFDDASSTLHVVARTFGGDARIYYYRTLTGNRRWTPWVKIDLEISSDHIIPVVYNNRIYLFWGVFTENPVMPSTIMIPAAPTASPSSYTIQQPVKTYSIQLAFSEYKAGKWTPKKVSNGDVTGTITASQVTWPDKGYYMFAPLDLPLYDFSTMFDANGKPVDDDLTFAKKAAAAAQPNGTIVINSYYYHTNTDSFDYVGGFELDLVKGYPVMRRVPYPVGLELLGINRMYNMLEANSTGVEATRGSDNDVFIPNLKKTPYTNLLPLQIGMFDKYNYLQDIQRDGLTKRTSPPAIPLGYSMNFFYQDEHRSYFVVREATDNGSFEFDYQGLVRVVTTTATQGLLAGLAILSDAITKTGDGSLKNRYFNFYHPLVPFFLKRLFTNGIDGLMERDTQLKGDFAYDPDPSKVSFQQYFSPGADTYDGHLLPVTYANGVVDAFPGYPKDDVDFSLQAGYGLYNWEVFFHAPLMIAERLSMNQQFDDADRWYRYIFNPMDTSAYPSPDKYWNTKPFFINTDNKYVTQRIENILAGINGGASDLVQDVSDWRNNPFQPHYIAEYRTVAYQKVAVMKYVGHLIRYGDYLFRQDTMETVNEATQLYILAAEILGPKPEIIPSAVETGDENYYQLEPKLDSLSNALVDVENLLPLQSIAGYNNPPLPTPGLPTLQTLYFGIPANQNLVGPTGFWDVVADRLFKIRHCQNIDGQAAPLALFSAPIDPGLLVRAVAAGLSIGSVLSDINSPLPLYRFGVMIQKAADLCNEVKSLGTAFLSVLEKKDGETMALLRNSHEIKMAGAVLTVKQRQVSEAQSAIDNLNKQKELLTIRQQYYSGLLNAGLTSNESTAIDLNYVSAGMEGVISAGTLLAAGLTLIPNFHIGASGFGGTPHAVASTGGESFGKAAELASQGLSALSRGIDKTASLLLTKSGYDRRAAEWKFQLDTTNKELEQLDVQLAGAQIRLAIAGQELSNQQLQIDQSQEMDDLMHNKFTNEELFTWMSTQLSGTYFRSYQLAYDIAKRAERCYRYELGLDDSSFINFGYWDSLKQGLLAGEQLFYDLKRMEMSYLDQNQRELELSKPISLSQLDPVALMKLKTTGECWINLPEELFDMDYPGHYMRRVRSVSLTIPCIAGPYTTVSCTLTMAKNSVRVSNVSSADAGQYSRLLSNGLPGDDPRFRDAAGALQSIATSTAQNDSGLFEVNFRDERYLPFEGAGAISLWHLQLPAAVRQFDYNTISDVIIHLKYTARDAGDALRANATVSLTTKINQMLVSTKDTGLMRLFSAKNDLSGEWYRFLNPVNVTDDQVLTLTLDSSRFPLLAQGRSIKITSVELVADSSEPINNLQVVSPAADSTAVNLGAVGSYGSWMSGTAAYGTSQKGLGVWMVRNPVANKRLTAAVVADGSATTVQNIVVIVHYQVS